MYYRAKWLYIQLKYLTVYVKYVNSHNTQMPWTHSQHIPQTVLRPIINSSTTDNTKKEKIPDIHTCQYISLNKLYQIDPFHIILLKIHCKKYKWKRKPILVHLQMSHICTIYTVYIHLRHFYLKCIKNGLIKNNTKKINIQYIQQGNESAKKHNYVKI